jgi:hypothetical protein
MSVRVIDLEQYSPRHTPRWVRHECYRRIYENDEGYNVTICITATCRHKGQNAVVVLL